MEGGIEHAFLDNEYVLGRLPNPSADGVAMARTPAHGLEDEEVEGTGVEIRAGHGPGGIVDIGI
jgi:hypothetical protein